MKTEIRYRILDLNPWQIDPKRFQKEIDRRMPRMFLPRNIDLTGFENRKRAKLIVGPRQSGKSTLVWSLLRARPAETVLFLNGEEALVRAWAISASGMIHDLENEFAHVDTMFFEEAQHIENASILIKGLIDSGRNLDILVTGSSSFHLMDHTRESLAGRAERRTLLPFSITEILDGESHLASAAITMRAMEIARRMMLFGSYPGVWYSEDPRRELSNLVEAFVLRDASDRYRIRRIDAFRRLLQLVAGQVGQMANLSEWAGNVGVSVSTVREYIGLLEESWILRMLPAFSGGKRREITSATKVHFFDMGIRNAVLGSFEDIDRRPDRGSILEGLVFCEISKILGLDWTLHYWRAKGGAEVDFVLARGTRCIGIEVKGSHTTPLTRSTRSFIEAYSPETMIIVSEQSTKIEMDRIGATEVRFVSVEEISSCLSLIMG